MANELIPNEFTTSLDDNRVRPYTTGMIRRSETIASIILLTSDENATKGLGYDNPNKDYLADLSSRVEALVSEASKTGTVNPVVPNGKIPMITLDGTHDYYGVFNNFSLLKVQESNEQIVKVHQHFGGEWNAFFFGAKPQIFTFNGFFIDSEDYPYYQEFMVAYDNYLAGRKCIENKMQMKIVYDGRMVDGYMLGITTANTAESPFMKQFSFTVLVRSSHWLRTNIVAHYSPGFGQLVQDRGFNIMSNIERFPKLNQENAISSQEDDTSGIVTNYQPGESRIG